MRKYGIEKSYIGDYNPTKLHEISLPLPDCVVYTFGLR